MKERDFLENKKEDQTYVSKTFPSKNFRTGEKINKRYVSKMFSMKDFSEFIREKNKVALYITPNQKQEIVAFVDESTKEAFFTLQRFTSDTYSPHQWSFSFGLHQLDKINKFVESLPYIDFSNKQKFKIQDSELQEKISKIKFIEESLDSLSEKELGMLLSSKKFEGKDFVNLAYRKKGLDIFEHLLTDELYFAKVKQEKNIIKDEKVWQLFFEKHDWIFGYGLDYRFMTIFDREMTVGDGGTQNQNKPTVDFLNEFSDFTVLVELKTPGTPLFKKDKNRAVVWKLSNELLDAFSQMLGQKAEWQIKGNQSGNNSKDGSKRLQTRTKDPKTILVVGNKEKQIFGIENETEKEVKVDTFELFRRDSRNIEIITYDELYERAKFIVNTKK